MSNPFAKLQTLDTFKYHMKKPDGGLMYFVGKDGKEDESRPVLFEINSTDSSEFKESLAEYVRAKRRELVKQGKKKTEDNYIESVTEMQQKTIFAAIKSWENLPDYSGGEVKPTAENRKLFAELSTLGYMHKQINDEAAEITNFMQS